MRLALGFLFVASCFAQSPALQQYVGLTSPQAGAISKLNSDFQGYVSTKQQRANTLSQELGLLYSKPAPDPNQVGVRYVELESIRRDLAAQLSTLQNQAAAQLTAAQAAAVQNLKAAAEARPLVSDAQCGFLLDPVSSSQGFSTSQVITGLLGVPGLPLAISDPLPAIPPAPSGTFCGSSIYPISVHQYLNLTDAQILTMFNASAAYNDYYARRQDRIADLYVGIRDETAKPSPDPVALGALYAELAAIGQDIQSQGSQLSQTARSVLTTQQATQLKTLQSSLALQPLVYEAESLNLLVLAPGTDGGSGGVNCCFYITAYPGKLNPVQSLPLQTYLSLTAAQVTAIHKLNADYQTYVSGKQSRIGTVDQELASLYSNPPADPNQLGVRYVELEAIRRDIAAHLATLQTQDAAALTKTQVSGIQSLDAAAALQPLIGDAQCGFLLDPSPLPTSSFANFLLGSVHTDGVSGYFSILSGYVTYPYIPPAPTASFCGSTTYPISVREYLNLTDAEVSTIFTQSAAYNDYYARKQDRIADVDVEIRDETAKPSPDPLALGLRYSELEGIGQELQTAGAQLREAARAVLSAPQSTQLKVLQDDAALQLFVSQAQACNLLVLAPGTGSNVIVILDPLSGGSGCPL
jgi:Spy/CpxP family protein refolding chaperone